MQKHIASTKKALVLKVLVSMEFGHHPTPCSPLESACRGKEISELTVLLKSSQLLEVQQADVSPNGCSLQ